MHTPGPERCTVHAGPFSACRSPLHSSEPRTLSPARWAPLGMQITPADFVVKATPAAPKSAPAFCEFEHSVNPYEVRRKTA